MSLSHVLNVSEILRASHIPPDVLQRLVDHADYEADNLDSGERHDDQGEVTHLLPLVVLLDEGLHVDADHDEKGQSDVPTQAEEDPDTCDDAVSPVDVIEIVKPSLFPIQPNVHPCQSELGEENYKEVAELEVVVLDVIGGCNAHARRSCHTDYKGPDGTEHKCHHVDRDREEVFHSC